jgi:hypothetical protein
MQLSWAAADPSSAGDWTSPADPKERSAALRSKRRSWLLGSERVSSKNVRRQLWQVDSETCS